MKKFFMVYGLLLLGLFAAFSYLESHTKDQRILKAKMRHSLQLINKNHCESAFSLLSQREDKRLKHYYASDSADKLSRLEKDFCALWQEAKPSKWSFRIERIETNKSFDYRVNLVNQAGEIPATLYFKKVNGELAFVKVN